MIITNCDSTGRLYTGYLDWSSLCKLDGESVMAKIESSKNGCTVRKPNNFSIFLLVFSRKKVYTFYSCGNFFQKWELKLVGLNFGPFAVSLVIRAIITAR